jgi:hypothetical protein
MAAANGIINSAVQGGKVKADTPDMSEGYGTDLSQGVAPPGAANPSVLAPAAAAPAGIIGRAQTLGMSAPPAAAPPAATTPPATTTDYTGQIQDAYHKYLGRTGETAGVDFYNNLLKGGMRMDRINQGFMESDEYKALHPAANPASAGPTLLGAPTKWDITSDQTVQGQMKNLIDPNSPYYQQWATAGAQDAAARGFTGNSSIRSTGIMDSVMRGATPIATSDASTYAKAAGYNADMPNQFAISNQNASNSMAQFSTAQQNDLTKAHLSANTQLAAASISADAQKMIATNNAQNAQIVATLNNTSQMAIAKLDQANKQILQTDANASSLHAQAMQTIAAIQTNPNVVDKEGAIQQVLATLNNGLAIMGIVANTLDFSKPPAGGEPVTT